MSNIINEYSAFNQKNKFRNYYIEDITDINILKEELMHLKIENSYLKNQEHSIRDLRKELKDAKDKIIFLQNQIEQLKKDQCEQQMKYNVEIQRLTNEKDFQTINFNKRLTIFDQKMNKVHQVEMENEVYKDELNDLKNKNKELEESVNLKKEELQINNKIKFKHLKNRVMNELIDAKKNILSLNIENMDIRSQIIFFQNNKLLEQIEFQKKEMDSIVKQNKELKLKIINLEKEIDIKEKVQNNLATKLNYKKKNNINIFNKSSIFNKYNKDSLFIKSNYIINNKNDENALKSNIINTSSTNIEQSINTIKRKTKSKNKINKIKRLYLNNIDLLLNNNYYSSNSKIENENNKTFKSEKNDKSYDYINDIISNKEKTFKQIKTSINNDKEKHNYNSDNSLIKTNQKKEIHNKENNYFFHKKQNQIIKSQNYEIENLKIKINDLKNQLSFNVKKYEKLYHFLEDCLNEFFSDVKLKNNNLSLNIEEIKQLNFDNFNKEEKYSLLILLMNHLLPLIIYNFNSNCNIGDNIFKTNINILDKTFNKRINYINDNTLKKAFLAKNNKLQKDLYLKNITFSNGSIPVLRKKYFSTEHKIKEDK